MVSVTIYCVQPFWRDGHKLAHGVLQQHPCEGSAKRAGERAARRNDGALVYSVTGDPVFDEWGRPQLVASIGAVPRVEF